MQHNAAVTPKNTEIKEFSRVAGIFKSNASSECDCMLAALAALPLREINITTEMTLPPVHAVSLPALLRRKTGKTNSVIMFASAYSREGAPGLGFRTARTVARQSIGKVLYIHASIRLHEFFKEIEMEMPVTLGEFGNSGGGSILPFVALSDSGLICSHYRGSGERLKDDSLKALMTALRERFELVIIGGDDILAGGYSSAFLHHADATILVTEAERTRAPVAKKLKRAVKDNGGRVIGAILNNRKYHIPEWIYGIFYGSYQ
jgi:hypothetical protein